MKRLLFKGNGNDLQNHLNTCKIKKCKVCKMAKETLKRWEEDLEEKE